MVPLPRFDTPPAARAALSANGFWYVMIMPFWVYMLEGADKSYHVGHTDDLERRLAQQQSGDIEGYTQTRRP